ncbi:MAG: bifunctional oligoribonuclease/PAP phosphatase NrnA [Oscillospiraceae bacterium]|jgi:phosphoesterase RecJ-like protein|nr:bifunctional oligoribonuclease/PAP phosphatase NrnA [Oscillospiraceae bacterium]
MENSAPEVARQIIKKLKESDNICIITHKSPDMDTLGSALGLYHALRKLGKKVKVAHDVQIARKYLFLFEGYVDSDFDVNLFVTVDIATPALFPRETTCDRGIDICIDHHIKNEIPAALKLVRADAAATGEIIYDIINLLGVAIDEKIACCLYVAIATDTGCFRQPNTTANSHKIVASLMETGIDYALINKNIFGFESLKDFELKKIFFSNAEFFFGGKLALVVITKDILQQVGLGQEEIDSGLYSELIKVEGVCISAVLREKGDYTKVSLRTNEGYNASEIANQWNNGGGHKRAAGCCIKGPVAEAKRVIIDTLEAELQ